MIRLFRQQQSRTASRRGIAVLIALWLNLAFLPCAIALEAQEAGHDCCPPSIDLQPVDCCEIDAVSPDLRDSKFDNQDNTPVVLTDSGWPSLQALSLKRQIRKPPDPLNHSPPRHKLFCVYLD